MSYDNPRIKNLDISVIDAIVALSDGNPGAISVLSRVVREADAIDPDSVLGAFGVFGHLDSNDIYGSRIWVLYKDVCGQSINKTIGALRCVQMGLVAKRDLDAAIGGDKSQFDLDVLLAKLKERLPAFVLDATAISSGAYRKEAKPDV